MKKILIIGHARHGKDTLAELLSFHFGYTRESSSMKSSELFLYDALKEKYHYQTPEECFDDRVHHRKEWHDLIADYNREDPAKLAKEILKSADIYVGMRSQREVWACREQKIFDLIIGIFDDRKIKESGDSFTLDFWGVCDIVIPNTDTIEVLEQKVLKLKDLLS